MNRNVNRDGCAAGGKRQVRPLRMLILVRTPSMLMENVLFEVHGLCSVAAHGASSAFVRQTFAGWHLTLCHGSSWCAYDVTAGCKITHCAGAAGAAGKSRSRVRAFGRVFTFPLLTVHVPFLSEKLTLDAAGHIKPYAHI